MSRRDLILTITVSACAAGAAGPAAQAPARDSARTQAAPGSAVVRGRVIARDTAAPLRRATVVLANLDGSPALKTETSIEGRFEFTAVPGGRYRLSVNPDPAAARYLPVTYVGPAGSVIVVEGSDAIESLELRVLRAGAISGRVTDEFGDPIALARITVLELLPGGRQRPTSGRGNASQTDDQGRFRVFGLEPGEYAVLAEMAPAPSGGATRPLPTYHPGTADFAEARTIELDEGQDAADADITIVRGRVLTVRGTVIDSQGRPAPDAFVSFMRSTARGGATSANVSVQRDGAFAVRDLVPAEYTVVARRRAGNASEFASVPLSVQGDIEDFVLTTRAGATVSGTMVFDPSPPPQVVSGRYIPYVRTVTAEPIQGIGSTTAPAKPDGAFVLSNLFGPLLLRASAPPGWHVKAVMLGGQDVTDRPTEFRTGERGIQIVMTQRAATLTGRVLDEDGMPVEAAVVAFGAERALWKPGFSTTRGAAATADGTYAIDGLQPGQYLVVALSPEESGGVTGGAEYFELLARSATAVTIADAGSQKLDLRLVRLQ
jgi:protocatechuate 3,4-dioxygenase beta subunit